MNHAASPSSWANLDNKSLSLIRRTLCSHSPPTTPLPDLLPALTSSTTVDAHLYVLLSIILRDFVHSWYSQITSEPSFTGELIALVAHCIRALEERARKLDIETLVFDELPALIHAHIADIRTAKARAGSALAPDETATSLFHALQPHPITTHPAPYTRLLATGLLACLLPTEDLASNCERSLITEILAETLLTTSISKLSEPWQLHELIHTLLKPPLPEAPPPLPQSLQTRCLALALKTASTAHFLISSLHDLILTPPPAPKRTKALIRTALPRALAAFLGLGSRWPWLQLLTRPFASRKQTLGRLLDDFLRTSIAPYLATEDRIVYALRQTRQNLFPGDVLGPAKEPPGVEERVVMREEAEKVLAAWMPGVWRGDMEGCLEVLEVREVNRVLVARVVELLVVRLCPELEERGAVEMLKERTGVGEGGDFGQKGC